MRTWLNYDPACSATIVEDNVSMTKPDQTYSIRELFDRMAKGLSLDNTIARPVYYEDNPDIDNPDPTQDPDFDFADYQREMENVNQRLSRVSESTETSEQSKDTPESHETQENA